RFVSCVGQHAIWSGSAALLLARRSCLFDGNSGVLDWISLIGQAVLPSAILHGLYDTFINRDMPYLVVASAVANFSLFVWLVERTRRYGLPLKQKGPVNIGGIPPKDWFRRGRR